MSLPSPNASAKLSAPIDLPLVRRLFSTPARVAESDFLRREVSARMQEKLLLIKIEPQRVLDAGCGEGADIAALQKRFTEAQIIGLDGAFSMLALAQGRLQAAQSAVNRLLTKWLPSSGSGSAGSLACADFAQLPFAANALDVVWSNLALQWHPQPDRVFAEWRRVLRVEGLLMFSCFGPDTFKEVRAAFETVDTAPHSLPFVDMHDFGDMLVNAGFSTPVMDMENITVTYETPQRLLADVGAWGGNPLESRRRGLLGRAAYGKVVNALEQLRDADGKIPLTFEVIYGHAFRPVPRTTASGESIIRFDLPKK
ncbi:SAM-dependent methyltransferase [Herbaspirillum sp. meg3]|jgi:malonyl-CoA O-methyltransferase|uniref:methyltransferase domain-containing protein n=1 Tax=Herbaspirillum sp. meg3 TaxID=2025949 RepID=UPI000B97CDB1|nr:methyltransferase domain-containing protein [Herbaspirillum sp. meg3]ASU37412.1 SAM-dependent methyltransferase [Herbaspirillum sp. meg3]